MHGKYWCDLRFAQDMPASNGEMVFWEGFSEQLDWTWKLMYGEYEILLTTNL